MIKPLISVNMVVHNGEKFIFESINSILNQTFINFELIIINDGSTDKTKEIISSFKDPRIISKNNEKNNGIVYSRNMAAKLSLGKYIAIQDADDISLPNRLELELEFLNNNPDFGLVGSFAELIDASGKSLNKIQSKYLSFQNIKINLLFKNCFTHSSILYRKDILIKYLFSSNFENYCEDYDMIVKVSNKMKVFNINKVLIKYRIHGKNISLNNKNIQKNNRKIISNQLKNLDIDPSKRELDIHLNLSKKIVHENLELLIDSLYWLEKLFIYNKKNNIYSQDEFYEKISDLWFNLVNNPKVFSIKLIAPYYKSSILKFSNIKLKDKLRFILKCLVSYKLKLVS